MSKFSTPILAHGPHGNTLMILGAATSMMREIGVSRDEISALQAKVMDAGSRAEAIAAIREWFPVETDDES